MQSYLSSLTVPSNLPVSIGVKDKRGYRRVKLSVAPLEKLTPSVKSIHLVNRVPPWDIATLLKLNSRSRKATREFHRGTEELTTGWFFRLDFHQERNVIFSHFYLCLVSLLFSLLSSLFSLLFISLSNSERELY